VNINFTLPPKNSVYGYVYLSVHDASSPADGATVELIGSAGTFQTVTPEDGRYQLQAPCTGEYTIRVSYPFYIQETRTVTLTGDAVNEDFYLHYGPFSSIHGTVTDSLTGSPLDGVNVVLKCWEGEFPVYELTDVTDEFGAYGFSSLQPLDYYYSLDFMKDGYLPLNIFLWPGPGIGEDLVFDAALEPLMSTSVSGTLKCWAGPLAGTVSLDDTIYVSTQDGNFEFIDITPGWHWLRGSVNGNEKVVSLFIANGQHLEIDISIPTYLIDRSPLPDSMVISPFDVGALLFGARPGATGAVIKLYSREGEVPGTASWDGPWLIFTPDYLRVDGQYTAEVCVPGELIERWNFTYYMITDNPPVIKSVSPGNGTVQRTSSPVDVTVIIHNDPANGLSDASKIYLDGEPLQTSISGVYGNWQLEATTTAMSHGWHALRAVAIDNQGLECSMNWNIFVSTGTGEKPYIYNLQVTPAISPGRQVMYITASVNEPLNSAIIRFDGYPNYTLNLGPFTGTLITGYWNGYIGTQIPPEGPLSFTLTGYGLDNAVSDPVTGTVLIDTRAPDLIADIREAWNTQSIEIHGSINDTAGVADLVATSSGGTIQSWLSGNSFGVTLTVNQDGVYTLQMNTTDVLGNSAVRTYKLLVDTEAPAVNFNLPAPDSTVRPGQTVTFTISDWASGLARGYLMYHSFRMPDPDPWNMEILLDGENITERVIYTDRRYTDVISGNTPYGYNYLASLASIQVSYNPSDYGFLNDGQHTLTVSVGDRAGNNAKGTLTFSSMTLPPDISEESMEMMGSGDNETLKLSFNLQENSDGGFGEFELIIDGVKINQTPTIYMDILPYMCNVRYTVTGNYQEGPHTISLTVIDGRGFSNTLHTGFYHIETLQMPLDNLASSGLYRPDFTEYSGSHIHAAVYNSSTGFREGAGSIYGYCAIDGPDSSLLSKYNVRSGNYILPMGGQLAFTIIETPFVDAMGYDFLSLWMTDITVNNLVRWGWGASILIYFNDGRGIKLFDENLKAVEAFSEPTNRDPTPVIYAHHEAPWLTWSGILDNSRGSVIGADGRLWKNYVVRIPDGIDRSHLSVVFVWETNNWFQNTLKKWNANYVVSISSRISNVAFVKSLIEYTDPDDRSVEVPTEYTIRAHFKVRWTLKASQRTPSKL